jgi:hypothetical protein
MIVHGSILHDRKRIDIIAASRAPLKITKKKLDLGRKRKISRYSCSPIFVEKIQ